MNHLYFWITVIRTPEIKYIATCHVEGFGFLSKLKKQSALNYIELQAWQHKDEGARGVPSLVKTKTKTTKNVKEK